ncbi:MAG: hypothetical protein V7K79_03640 [Nostoc sp.]
MLGRVFKLVVSSKSSDRILKPYLLGVPSTSLAAIAVVFRT